MGKKAGRVPKQQEVAEGSLWEVGYDLPEFEGELTTLTHFFWGKRNKHGAECRVGIDPSSSQPLIQFLRSKWQGSNQPGPRTLPLDLNALIYARDVMEALNDVFGGQADWIMFMWKLLHEIENQRRMEEAPLWGARIRAPR